MIKHFGENLYLKDSDGLKILSIMTIKNGHLQCLLIKLIIIQSLELIKMMITCYKRLTNISNQMRFKKIEISKYSMITIKIIHGFNYLRNLTLNTTLIWSLNMQILQHFINTFMQSVLIWPIFISKHATNESWNLVITTGWSLLDDYNIFKYLPLMM